MNLEEPLTPFKMATIVALMAAMMATIVKYSQDHKFSFINFIINGAIAWVTVFIFYKGWLYFIDYIKTK